MTSSSHQTFSSLLLAATILALPLVAALPTSALAQGGIGITVQIAPPPLPVYVQPPMPESGYIWTPGYWSWVQDAGYYWVPGTWVLPPSVGVLWTPPYWGWSDGAYRLHAGYWGPHVGYYGGVNYGYGYTGNGYQGGRWEGGGFAYNRSVNNFGSVHIAHAYQQHVMPANNTRTSFAGGAGGLRATPTAMERAAEHDNHLPVTAEQANHSTAAARIPALAASNNHERPAIAATSRPGQFDGAHGVPAGPAGAAAHPMEHAAPPPVAAGPARPAEMHGAAPNAGARPGPAAMMQQPAARPAEQAAPPHMAPEAPRPAAAQPAAMPGSAPAPHPAAAPHPEPEKRPEH